VPQAGAPDGVQAADAAAHWPPGAVPARLHWRRLRAVAPAGGPAPQRVLAGAGAGVATGDWAGMGAAGASPRGDSTTRGTAATAGAGANAGSRSASKVYFRLKRSAAQPVLSTTLTTGSLTGTLLRTRISAPSAVPCTLSETLLAGSTVSPYCTSASRQPADSISASGALDRTEMSSGRPMMACPDDPPKDNAALCNEVESTIPPSAYLSIRYSLDSGYLDKDTETFCHKRLTIEARSEQ
jgi:hypothetical protein